MTASSQNSIPLHAHPANPKPIQPAQTKLTRFAIQPAVQAVTDTFQATVIPVYPRH